MIQPGRRTWIAGLFCALSAGLCLFFFVLGPDRSRVAERLALLELAAKDVLSANVAKLSPDPRLVFIGIDQPTYADVLAPEEIQASPILAQLTNSFPWPRDVWAAVIEQLSGAGAKVIMLDLVFAAPAPGDEKLRQALERHRDRVVIGANFLGGNRFSGEAQTILLPSESVLGSATAAAPWADSRVGYVNFFTDLDDVARRAVFRVQGERGLARDASMYSLAARALQKFGATNVIPPDTVAHLFRFSGAPGLGYKPIPLYDIFLPSHWSNNWSSGAYFKDKIVIVGPAANIFHDEHRTPYPGPAMPGPEIHLNVIGAALRGEFLGETNESASRWSIMGGGLVALLLAMLVRAPIRRLFVAGAVIGFYWTACWALFKYGNFFLLAATPVMALSLGTLATFTYDFRLLRKEKNRIRSTLERYVSKDVVREVLDNPDTYLNTLGGVRKPITVLFSDLRGFTTMTEGADPTQLVTQLNEYFKEMVGIVFAEHGSLDKFIGDCVMALWGGITTEGPARDAQHAVAAALAMRKALARLNVNRSQRGLKALSFGIGINHGDAIVGNLGSAQKMEVSVIGDAVNLAARLEGVTKEYDLDLLLGESMVPLVSERFALRTVGSVLVKGRTRPVRIFTVAADRQAGEAPPPWLPRYEEGVELYQHRKFSEGAEAFKECLVAVPEDFLSRIYYDQCRELMLHPPGPDWDTVVVMKTK